MALIFLYALFTLFARCTPATVSSTSYQLCTTKYGITSKTPVPSTTYSLSLTFHPTLKTTTTPVVTVKPPPTTTIVTYTQSIITTTTTTLPQSTTTVPTPAGFTYPSPVPSPSPSSQKRAAIDTPLLEVRGGSNPSGVRSCRTGPSGTPTYYPARYPTSVLCAQLVEVFSTSTIVSTAPTTATVLAPQSTIEVSTTTTTTITNTATVTPAAATYYAACAPQNILSQPSGYFFSGYYYYPGTYQAVISNFNGTGYDCCVACITDPNCAVGQYSRVDGFGSCTLNYGGNATSCADTEQVDVSIEAYSEEWDQTVSLGNCAGLVTFFYPPPDQVVFTDPNAPPPTQS